MTLTRATVKVTDIFLFVSSLTNTSARYYRWRTSLFLFAYLSRSLVKNNEHSLASNFAVEGIYTPCKYNQRATAVVFVSMFPVRIDDGGRRYFRATLPPFDASLRMWRRPRPCIETLIIGEGERVPFWGKKSTGIRMHCLYYPRFSSSKLMYIRFLLRFCLDIYATYLYYLMKRIIAMQWWFFLYRLSTFLFVSLLSRYRIFNSEIKHERANLFSVMTWKLRNAKRTSKGLHNDMKIKYSYI